MALVFAGNNGLSAVAFTILGDTASEFDITVNSSGSGPGERGSGNRSIGDLIIVNDNITGSVSAGSGDDVIWIRAGTGTHHLDGGNGNDALYGNAGNDILDAGGGNNFVSGGDGSDELITGGGNDILLGGNGNDHLSSGNGDDVLMGGAGNDVLSAAANNDVLIGGTGNDTLTGGGGADRFVFAEAGVANVDHITDYQAGVPSTIDLSPLLNSNFGSGSNVVDFARLVQNGSDVMVQADLDGTANGVDWQDVVVLDGYGTAGADVVNVYFNNQNHILAA